MTLCILVCVACVILGFKVFDVEDKIHTPNENKVVEKKRIVFPKPLVLAITLLLLFGMFYGVLGISQVNGKLLIQSELGKEFTINLVAIYFGIIIFISRVARVVSNMVYPKLYKKLGNKMGVVISAVMMFSLILMLVGFFINAKLIIRMSLIAVGFSGLFAIHDAMKLFIEVVIVEKINKQYHQEMFSYISLFRKMGGFIFSTIVTLILTNHELYIAIIALSFMSLIVLLISFKFFKQLKTLA
jgi:hypothetical protein